MRILLTSAGRRTYLVHYFREALAGNGEVWASDLSPYAPALYCADRAALLPHATDDGYVDALFDLCTREKIDLVVPLFDLELVAQATVRQRFLDAGVRLLISPPETINMAADKYQTAQFGREHNLLVPETVLSIEEALSAVSEGRMRWPLMVKQRKGFASLGLHLCHSEQEVRVHFRNGDLDIIQEYLEGDEYGYDLLCDFQHRPVSVFCKKKLAMRAGETDKAVSTDREDLIEYGRRLAENLDLHGPLDADVFLTDRGPCLLELNPRFGGGYPCSHGAGADFPRKLVRMMRGETVEPDIGSCPAGVYMFKQYDIVIQPCEAVDTMAALSR